MPELRIKKPDRYVLALLVIIAINIVLKWQFFCGLVQADDFSYGVYSYTMFRDIWPWSEDMDFRMLRFGFMLPAALLFKIFPPTEFVAVLYPMMASFGTIVLVYVIGKLLFGPMAGIMSAFIIATFPSDVIFGTMLLPDIVVPFYLCGTVLFF
ncbi:glycosyltransferase family 39 protein, partial [Candidatus Latescibacterota bacterium]